ncbi:hypothetical protein [Demequina sp. NBRC 110055]|uniref:hypothetical protein n=1 Tax=Demequina sp. NBRC 110055 TaxID=1570344 RepID=UPI000A041A26|nr:hypothetical protein [Demequina sp. NBRC 110055]
MKLSDALRGAADTAPVDGVTVSTADASRKVARRRALRTGSNGVVAVGAVAILGVGLIGPSFASAGDEDRFAAGDMATEESAPAMGGDASGGAASGEAADGYAGGSMLASPWMCGADFSASDPAWEYGDASGVEFSVGSLEAADGGYEIERTLTASRPVDLVTGGDYVVTWDGIIVGSYIEPDPVIYGPADEPSLPAGEVYERLDPATEFSSLQSWQTITAVNCWDGAPLPAGDYEVHLAQTLAYPVVEVDEPATDPAPSAEPSNVPSAVPSDMPTEESEVTDPPVTDMPEIFRVAADPIALTIEGERVDDPFGAYLGTAEPEPLPEPTGTIEPDPVDPGEPGTPVEPTEPKPDPLPTEPTDRFGSKALTPDVARQMFESAATDDSWDMAAGSYRWIMNDGTSGVYRYYGCAWGGGDGSTFPESTSTMELLDVDVTAPSSLSVSYGFVVDGNPEVAATVTNTSDYAITNFWATQPQLYLVRDGRIVAEAYPQSIDRSGDMVIMREEADMAADAVAPDGAEMLIAPAPESGALAPDASVSGTYLWRDVTRCDGGAGGVEAGTYTLLASTSLNVSDYDAMYYEDGTVDDSGLLTPQVEPLVPKSDALSGNGSSSSMSSAGDEPAVLPAPALDVSESAWIDLQRWTSLGTITVR